MAAQPNRAGERECRIGIISRLDYVGVGFRKALLDLAADVFRRLNVHFIILAGGLIDGRNLFALQCEILRKIRVAATRIRKIEARVKLLDALITECENKGRDYSKHESEKRKLEAEKKVLEAQVDDLEFELEELQPEALAEKLSLLLPHFTNAVGEEVKLHILTSPAYDGAHGASVGQLLHDKRKHDIRHYPNSSHRFQARQAGKWVYVLTPPRRPWLRGDFFSTPNERVVKDKLKQSSKELPDLFVTGCFGTSLLIPDRFPRPVVCVPDCHKIEDAAVSDNQIGVGVVTLTPDQEIPRVYFESFKDCTMNERRYVGLPAKISPAGRQLIELIKSEGRVSTGQLADDTGLTRETVERTLKGYVKHRRILRNVSWAGLVHYKEARLWDFPLNYMQLRLPYKPPVERKSFQLMGIGCFHAGARTTDYEYYFEMFPKVALAHGCDVVAIAGDSVEGLAHDLMLKKEVIGSLNYTEQEDVAGRSYAIMLAPIARSRFALLYEQHLSTGGGAPPNHEAIAAMVQASLPDVIIIKGNHDEWEERHGFTPLTTMLVVLRDRLVQLFTSELETRGLCHPRLHSLIERKLIQLDREDDGVHYVRDGVHIVMTHPHMGDTKTASIRMQSALDTDGDAHVVVSANFHRALHLCQWEPELGQHLGIQIGTGKHSTRFERRKQKRIGRGQGFGCLRVDHSASGEKRRIVASEATFYNNPVSNFRKIDDSSVLYALLAKYELRLGLQAA